MSEAQYAELTRVFARVRRPWRLAIVAALGVICLFSTWTFLLGCCLLVLVTLNLLLPAFPKGPTRRAYEQLTDLRGPVKYAVSTEGLSFSGTWTNASCGWPNLVQWRLLDEWLILFPAAMPLIFFRVSDLEEAGIFESVMGLAKKHGVNYNKPNEKA